MSCYKRNYQENGTYFFTVNLADRNSSLLIEHIRLLQESITIVKSQRPFRIPAWVVLPDHLHFLWTLPPRDADYSTRWRAIKSRFTKNLPGGKSGCWQKGYWEHTIQSERDFNAHMDYIHINPLKHGYVKRVQDWRYSSFQFWVSQGVYTKDWAGGMEEQCLSKEIE